MQVSKEMSLLLFLSRVEPAPSVLKQAQTLIDSGLNWDSLIADSARHGTSGLIYKNLLRLGHVPQSILDKLENTYNHTLKSNVQLAAETDRVIDSLQAKGIEAIALKGPLTSEIIFGDIGLYPSGDIDTLVRVKDIDGTVEYLESDGYKLTDKSFDDYRDFFIRELYHISLSKGRHVIEPHWNLFFRYFNTPREFWWEESISVRHKAGTYNFLSPEKNILYNAFRIYSKAFAQLRYLVMISELLRYYRNEIDWEKMFHYAGEYRFENTLRAVLRLSAELLGAQVPGEYMKLKSFRSRVLHPFVRRMALKGGNSHPGYKILLTVVLHDDLTGWLKILSRRLFPSMGEIISRYRLPADSFKAKCYYLFNPALLLMQKHIKR